MLHILTNVKIFGLYIGLINVFAVEKDLNNLY